MSRTWDVVVVGAEDRYDPSRQSTTKQQTRLPLNEHSTNRCESIHHQDQSTEARFVDCV